jgi:predicted ATPase with chaperone activity
MSLHGGRLLKRTSSYGGQYSQMVGTQKRRVVTTTSTFSMQVILTSLSLAKLLDEGKRLALQATLNLSAGSGMNNVEELIVGQIQKFLKLKTTEGELLKLALLAQGSDSLKIKVFSHFVD